MFASSIVNFSEKSNTSNKEERERNEDEDSLCESPDTVEMISTSSFTYESIGTMATSSPTPPLIHEENILSSMSPTAMADSSTGGANVHSTMHTMIQETIIETSGQLLCPPAPPGSAGSGMRSEDDNNTDEDNVSTVSSSLNQLSSSESKCTASYLPLDHTSPSYEEKQLQYHHNHQQSSAYNNNDSVTGHNVPIINSSRPSITFDYLDDLFNFDYVDSSSPSTQIPVQHVDVESASENMLYCHPEIRLPHVNLWEENWLFKKKRKSKNFNNYFTYTSLDFASECVRMFIPNPSQPAQACVGDIPVELLDDLPERHSPAASLIFSDDEVDERDQEQDQLECDQVNSTATATTKDPVTISSASVHSPLAKRKCESVNASEIITKEKENIICNDNKMTHTSTVSNIDKHSPFTSSRSVDDKVPQGNVTNNKLVKSSCASLNNQSVPREMFASPDSTSRLSPEKRVKSNNTAAIYPVHQMRSCENNIAKSFMAQVPPFVPLSKRMESARSDPSFLIKPCDASVQPGILIQFCCMVRGTKPLDVAWFKGDTQLKNDDTFRTFTSGNQFGLEIKDTKVQHSDKYSCVVFNSYGEQWSDFKLDVKPRSPSVACKKEVRHLLPLS